MTTNAPTTELPECQVQEDTASESSWSTESEDCTDDEDPASSGDDDDLRIPEDMMEEAVRLEQAPDTQDGLDQDLWLLARDIWDGRKANEDENWVLLETAIRLCRRSLDMRPLGHPWRAHSLHNLAKYINERAGGTFGYLPNLTMLTEGLHLLRQALVLRPPGSRHHRSTLQALFFTVVPVYSYGDGDITAFREAVTSGAEVLDYYPSGEYGRELVLSRLGMLWWQHSIFTESLQDRELSLSYSRQAAHHESIDWDYSVTLWNQFASRLVIASEIDLDARSDEVLEHRRRLIIEPSDPMPSILDTSLGRTALMKPDLEKIQEAILVYQNLANSSRSSEIQRASAWSKLGNVYENMSRAKVDDDYEAKAYLSKACDAHGRSLELLPTLHEDRANALSFLSNCLAGLFDLTADSELLHQAISHAQASLTMNDVMSDGETSSRASALFQVAGLLMKQAALRDSQLDDQIMNTAVDHCQEALAIYRSLSPGENVQIPMMLCSTRISEAFLTQGSSAFNPERGVEHLLLALRQVDSIGSHTLCCTNTAMKLLETMVLETDLGAGYRESLLHAYRASVDILVHVASFGHDLDMRIEQMGSCEDTGKRAVIVALNIDQIPAALEMLEQTHGLFWSQALNLREADMQHVPELQATELRSLMMSLEANAAEDALDLDDASTLGTSYMMARYIRRKQADRVEALVREIRLLPGLTRFMFGLSYQQLMKTAERSFIVVLLSHMDNQEALLLRRGGESVHRLSLANITREQLRVWMSVVHQATPHGRRPRVEEDIHVMASKRLMFTKSKAGPGLQVMAALWTNLVKPILQALQISPSNGRERPRLHWYATGKFAFLPLHAAGINTQGPHNSSESCANYVVSSYTPNLTVLRRARGRFATVKLSTVHALLVSEPAAPGMVPLPGVHTELGHIQDILSNHVASLSVIPDGGPSSVADVVKSLPTASIAHIACHGIQTAKNPLKSGFCLHDGLLTLARLMRLRNENATLAFLSACETAQGAPDRPQHWQSLHLCTAMLFCGFNSVIGNMWGINDADGPIVARKVYQELCRKDTIDADDIAYALDAGVEELRKQAPTAVHRWAPFVHYGA